MVPDIDQLVAALPPPPLLDLEQPTPIIAARIRRPDSFSFCFILPSSLKVKNDFVYLIPFSLNKINEPPILITQTLVLVGLTFLLLKGFAEKLSNFLKTSHSDRVISTTPRLRLRKRLKAIWLFQLFSANEIHSARAGETSPSKVFLFCS
jgi:hypothetical protein